MSRICLLVCFALSAQSLYATPQPDKVAEVAAGKLKEAQASWWGFDTEDSTAFLQAALNSKAAKVIVDKQATPWITGPLALPSNKEIVFEEGVELLAKAGLFQGRNESLLRATNTKNLKLVGLGKGATLRMRKSDYQAEPYEKAEWRHGISLRGVENVTVENLSIVSTGGDGILVAGGKTNYSRNVTIRNVICDDNHRQGISVISADKLLIEDCVLKNTQGTAPQAGIDFEPNNSREQLTDCVMRRCVLENNAGDGINIYLKPLRKSPIPISIRIEDCIAKGNKRFGFNYRNVYGVKGSCEVSNCRFENNEESEISISQKEARSTALTMKETTIIHNNEKSHPIQLIDGDYFDLGGVDFGVVRITDSVDRSPVLLSESSGLPREVRGTLHVQHGGATKNVDIDDAWFTKEYPNAARRIPRMEPTPERFVPLEKANVGVDTKCPLISQCHIATYWIYAEKGTSIRCALSVRKGPAGKYFGVLTLPNGKTKSVTIPADKTEEFDFVLDDVPETGVYRLAVDAARGSLVSMLRCNQTVVVPAVPEIELYGSTAPLYLYVPSGTEAFGVHIRGRVKAGQGVKASIVDPTGRTVWSADNICAAVQFEQTARTGKIEGVWKIVLAKPSELAFGSVNVTILGVPPLVGLSPKQLLVLQK